MINVCVVGLGHIGLPLAILAALKGHHVAGVDISKERLDQIRSMDEKSFEPSIGFFLQDEQVIKNLHLFDAVPGKFDYFVICVPSSVDQDNNFDDRAVRSALESIKKHIKYGTTVIIESTLPVGYTRKYAQMLEDGCGLKLNKEFFVAYSPERILPGHSFRELIFNDRIIGGTSDASASKAMDFYYGIIKGQIFLTDAESAEMTKIVENSHRLVEIAFANQIALTCKRLSLDPEIIIELANRHPRVKILSPGIGVGGECIPVHPKMLYASGLTELPSLINDALTINLNQEKIVVGQVLRICDQMRNEGKYSSPRILFFGLSYKQNVKDLRNAPAINIVRDMQNVCGIEIKVFDPLLSKEEIKDLGFCSIDSLAEYKWANFIVFLVGHDAFLPIKDINFGDRKVFDPINFLAKKNKENTKKFALNK